MEYKHLFMINILIDHLQIYKNSVWINQRRLPTPFANAVCQRRLPTPIANAICQRR